MLQRLELDPAAGSDLGAAVDKAWERLTAAGYTREGLSETIVSTLMQRAVSVAREATEGTEHRRDLRRQRLDRILTSRTWGYLTMLALLTLVFYLTVRLSNLPSAWLSALFRRGEPLLLELLSRMHAPPWLGDLLVTGVYRTVGWVISVMLPPTAIFFPLFTLLEDVGYLPRVAYNLDRPFCRCNACGKQALTLCMGFGCNAVGVMGCRIIDSKRERLLAILTNAFVPCNGKFSALIALITLFFVGSSEGLVGDLLAALILTALLALCLLMTLAATKLLSVTLLRGQPSSFTLELPPYRRPQVGRVILHSLLNRTLFVLGRAVAVAAPAGLVLWLMGNLTVDGMSLLRHCAAFLDPIGAWMGMDGVILAAFLLGLPANETVIPIMLMVYQSQNGLTEAASTAALGEVLLANGWSWVTALCVVLFFLFHWPCSTTLITVKKETKSLPLTLLAAVLPTVFGVLCCLLVSAIL